MADPISATFAIFCGGIEAASAIADFREKRRIRKEARAARAATTQVETSAYSASAQSANLVSTIATLTPLFTGLPMSLETQLASSGSGIFPPPPPPPYVRTPTRNSVDLKPRFTGRPMSLETQLASSHLTGPDKEVTAQSNLAPKQTQIEDHTSTIEELFLVLGTLGQQLISLGVIDQAQLPPSHASMTQSFFAISPNLSRELQNLPLPLQYCITCGFIFCTACYPMHIYRGFGCGVLSDMFWGIPPEDTTQESYASLVKKELTEMDRILAYHKCLPDNLRLLKKIPKGVDKAIPRYGGYDDKIFEPYKEIYPGIIETFETSGFYQPKDKRIAKIATWEVHCSIWRGGEVYYNLRHQFADTAKFQYDPGRMLFGWLVWKRLDLQPGQAVFFVANHIAALAQWLEGLDNMNFKTLRGEDLEYSHVRFPSKVREFGIKQSGNEYGFSDLPECVVLDPKFYREKNEIDWFSERVESRSLIRDVNSQDDLQFHITNPFRRQMQKNQQSSTKSVHRPAPAPPIHNYRKVKAKFPFQANDDEEELTFNVHDVLEIIDDKRADGWFLARMNGKVGLIPESFVEDL